MILVVEGPSAAGKTTWTARWPARFVVPETRRAEPPAVADTEKVARYFAGLNCARWSSAIAIEHGEGIAICDTDPLKLHYDYCLARIGHGSWTQFQAGVEACRNAIAGKRLGMADLVICCIPDDAALDRHRHSDLSRTRRNFAIHRALGPALNDWYRTLERLDPGRVVWELPPSLPEPAISARFDLCLFDEWIAALPTSE
jgi:hypothetical protein